MDATFLRVVFILSLSMISKCDKSAEASEITLHTIELKGTDVRILKNYGLNLGDPYSNSIFGKPGVRGETGEKGVQGDQGPLPEQGTKGQRGEKGDKGLPAFTELKGAKGENGNSGNIGLSGQAGERGICTYPSELDGEYPFGPEDEPADVTCKYSDNELTKTSNETYYMGPKGQILKVFCKENGETCIQKSTKTQIKPISYSKNPVNKVIEQKNGPFWLSEHVEDILKTLYDLTSEQVMWLQERSTSIRQRLRYHCDKSVPYTKTNISSSVRLLSWQDVPIGPYPTQDTPLFYSVPQDTDNCAEGSKSSTDIVLQSANIFMLPIIDIQIRDIRDVPQAFSLESVELCFG